MALKLNVPLVKQLRSMSCWYASACMVAYYRRAGPRLGLPDKWVANTGIDIPDFIQLAQNEGLKPVRRPGGNWSSGALEASLAVHGPIWCAGHWDGFPHIVVLTGVDGNQVFINDPAGPRRRTESLGWFNTRLDKHVPNCMLFMPA